MLVYLFLYIPIVVLIVFAFNDDRTNYFWKGFTTKWFVKLFTHSDVMDEFINSLIVAGFATVISVVIGTIGAIGIMRFEYRLKKLISTSLYIPIVVPEVALGVSILMLFNIVHLPLGLMSIILAHCTFCIPFVVIIMRSRLTGLDLSVEDASMDLGANRLVTFVRITLPLLVPGIMSSIFMCLTLSLDDVIISNFVSGPGVTTFPVKVLSMAKTGITPETNALTTIMVGVLVIGILVNAATQALLRKRARVENKRIMEKEGILSKEEVIA
jgi:spermidine/putrescine transport system permease protein